MMVEHPQTEGQRGAIGDCPQLSSSIAIPSLLAASSSKSPSPVGLALFESLTAVPVASFYFFSPPTHREPQSAQCLQHSEKGKKRVQADTSSAKGSPEISETVQSRAVQGESSAAPSVSAPMSADRNKRRRMQQASFGTLTERMEEEACGEASNVESDERNVEVEGEVVTPTEANAAGRDVSDQTDSVCVNGRTPISPTISDISDAVSSIRISADDALAIPEDLCEDGKSDSRPCGDRSRCRQKGQALLLGARPSIRISPTGARDGVSAANRTWWNGAQTLHACDAPQG